MFSELFFFGGEIFGIYLSIFGFGAGWNYPLEGGVYSLKGRKHQLGGYINKPAGQARFYMIS